MDKLKCESGSSAPWGKAKKEEFAKFADWETWDLSKLAQEMDARKNMLKVFREESQSQSIANILKEEKDALKVEQLRKNRVAQLKSKRVSLQQELNLNQDKNRRREEELEKKKANLKDRKQKGNLQLNKARKKLADIIQLGHRLLDTSREVCIANNLDQKIKETTESIAKKQPKLALKKKQEADELIRLNVEKEMLETQLETINKQIIWIRNEKEVRVTIESEMAKVLSTLEKEKNDLTAQLCHEKNQLMMQRQKRFKLLKDIENLKKENEDDKRIIAEEEMELKKRMKTATRLERRISKADAPKKKKKDINKTQLVTKPEISAFDELLMSAQSTPMERKLSC
ncbi:unnamed protein product [Ceutorhynchus assimilis]|uniref:Uncharacterized protein n=1 Tax=Ceutorhynchus assimilis TaxID=467358 RepID=A0A9N9QRP9_9CUCU|nr:unnamed protein product [Ceutorhynchus assimilis]